MGFELYSQNLSLTVCIVFAVVAFYIVSSLYKYAQVPRFKSKKAKNHYVKNNRIQFITAIPVSLILSLILFFLVGHYTDSSMPVSFIVMCLPFTVMLSLLSLSIFVKKRMRIITSVMLVVGLVFSLIIINNYYRYYPTIGTVFGRNDAQALNSGDDITVNYSVTSKQQYYNVSSVQASVANLSSPSTSGKLYAINIPGTVSKFNARSGYVYVPAIYNSPLKINLPVIVLTAGVPGTPDDWVNMGLQGIMDNFAKTHDGITPIVFVVDSLGSINNDTECVNSPRGNVETYLTVDVPNYIKKNFHVDDSAKNWAIGGLSMGGMCSIMLTLRHPNVYNYFIDLGGEIGPEVGSEQQTIDTLFGGSESNWAAHQPSTLLTNNTYKNIGGFFGDGNQDSRDVVDAISQLSLQTKEAGMNTVTETINGAHTFNVWEQTYKDALPWISNRIGATQCSASCL
jgi:enterochelin esterase-like enzyme